MFKTKLSVYMFVILLVFLIANFMSYMFIKNKLIENYKKDEQIIFLKIKDMSNKLINKLLVEFNEQKSIILSNHKKVLNYIENKDIENINLTDIHTSINKNIKDNPYDIYITNSDLIIKNTTYKADLNFDLSFAKEIFKKHKKSGIIGLSAPNFENISQDFFSYSDSYISNTKRVLQTSYRYEKTAEYVQNIKELLVNNSNIINSSAYVMFSDGTIQNLIDSNKFKISNNQIIFDTKNSLKLYKKLKDTKYLEELEKKDDKSIKTISFLEKSSIFPNNGIIFSIVFNQQNLINTINRFQYIMFFLTFLSLIAIYYIFRIRDNELLLSQKDKFIEYSIHEIQTPLTIISLNNQLRDKKQGNDKYSQKIENAIKTLQSSYNDMIFLLTKNNIAYKIESISLKKILLERIEYFEQIAVMQGREIVFDSLSDVNISLSKVELERLIDNNLSNAIKYSDINSKIVVSLNFAQVTFLTQGQEISNKSIIFNKYERNNNNISGGSGIGLNIVYNICSKYNIKIKVTYKDGKNLFFYDFRHIIDTRN